MNLKERIEAGKLGKFEGLDNGFNRLNEYVFGVQRKCITLIGGQSGCYKSTMLDFIVQNAIRDARNKGVVLNVFYNSFEIDKLTKQCNWLSTQIYSKHGVIIPSEVIKGFGKNRLTKEQGKLVDGEIPMMEDVFDKIKWTFKSNNPTGLYNEAWGFFDKRGKFDYENYIDLNGDSKKKIVGYKLNNPDEYNLMVTDHLYLLKKERDFDVKRNIDKFSEYQVDLSRLFGMSFINLQQFNQSISSIERMKFKGADLAPEQSSFRDSTNPYSDSDIVMGLMSPFKLGMESCLDYDIRRMKDKMVMFKIIKNRLSRDNIAIGLMVNAKAGYFKELPLAIQMTENDYKQIEKI